MFCDIMLLDHPDPHFLDILLLQFNNETDVYIWWKVDPDLWSKYLKHGRLETDLPQQ